MRDHGEGLVPAGTAGSGPYRLAPAMAPTYRIERSLPDGAVRLRLVGEFDVAQVAGLRDACELARAEAGSGLLILDLSELDLLSAMAARVLVETEQAHRDGGGHPVVQHVPPDIDRHLRASGLDRELEIVDPLGLPAPLRPPAGVRGLSLTFVVHGVVTPWTVVLLQRRIREACARGHPGVGVDLGAAILPQDRTTVMLGGALRRLSRLGAPLTVRGAPPALASVLSTCAPDVEIPDRAPGFLT